MTPEEKLKRLYRLNGQLEHIKRQMGSAYGVLCSLTDRRATMREGFRRSTMTSSDFKTPCTDDTFPKHNVWGAWLGIAILAIDIFLVCFLLSLLGPVEPAQRAPAYKIEGRQGK